MSHKQLTHSGTEHHYDFRRRLEQVHFHGRRNRALKPKANEVEIRAGWRIVVSEKSSPLLLNTARDLQDYLQTSMNTPVLVKRAGNLKSVINGKNWSLSLPQKKICLASAKV